MPQRFLFTPIERLSADGTFETVDSQGAKGRLPIVLLARELCAFEFHDPGGGATTAGLAAARQHAARATPFVNPGCLVRRQGPGYAIWWWNLDAVAEPLRARFGGAAPRLLPDSLARPAGDGWRIVRSAPGFEAQFWRAGVLRASAWRLQPFDEAAWLGFTRIQREDDAPSEPPAPQTLPLLAVRVRAGLAQDLTPREAGVAAAAAGVALMLMATAYFAGQGFRLAAETRSLAASAATLPGPAAARPRVDVAQRKAWLALSRQPDPQAGLARAISVVEMYGASPTAYAADHAQVSLTLPYSAISSLNRIALELRDTGLYSDIRPLTDDEGGTIELRLTLAGADAVNPDE